MSLLQSLFENTNDPRQWLRFETDGHHFYEQVLRHMQYEDVGGVDEMRQEFEYQYGYDEDDDSMNWDDEFESWLESELIDRFSATIQYVSGVVGPDWHIPLWRAVTVKDLKDMNLANVGVFWAYSKDSAFPYFGKHASENTLIVHASADIRNVDWIATLGQNISQSFTDENEIRLDKNAPIRIHGILYKNQQGEREDKFDPPKEARA
jgi:hypothetical protein